MKKILLLVVLLFASTISANEDCSAVKHCTEEHKDGTVEIEAIERMPCLYRNLWEVMKGVVTKLPTVYGSGFDAGFDVGDIVYFRIWNDHFECVKCGDKYYVYAVDCWASYNCNENGLVTSRGKIKTINDQPIMTKVRARKILNIEDSPPIMPMGGNGKEAMSMCCIVLWVIAGIVVLVLALVGLGAWIEYGAEEVMLKHMRSKHKKKDKK